LEKYAKNNDSVAEYNTALSVSIELINRWCGKLISNNVGNANKISIGDGFILTVLIHQTNNNNNTSAIAIIIYVVVLGLMFGVYKYLGMYFNIVDALIRENRIAPVFSVN